MEQTNKEKLKSKKNFGKNLSKNKKELQNLIKEKIKELYIPQKCFYLMMGGTSPHIVN